NYPYAYPLTGTCLLHSNKFLANMANTDLSTRQTYDPLDKILAEDKVQYSGDCMPCRIVGTSPFPFLLSLSLLKAPPTLQPPA
ncbi:hypothetical protein LTS18_014869, partial [Coniosporium uncinatum]